MTNVSRRLFMSGCGLVTVGAIGASVPLNWAEVYRLASESKRVPGKGVLVVVTLYGGNDGLNTVIPYTQNALYDARPELTYGPEEVLVLDEQYGLNPGMKGLADLFRDGSLAIVRGVGYPDQDRSHFRSMDIWQSGSPDNNNNTGWIGRWLDNATPNPVNAINVGNILPLLAMGSSSSAATLSTEHVRRDDKHVDMMSAISKSGNEDSAVYRAVRDSYAAAVSTAGQFDQIFEKSSSGPAFEERASDNILSSQLSAVSRCIRSGLDTRVYCVSLTGFDTHADERGRQQRLLELLDKSMTTFLQDMAAHELGQDVVVMAYSEFGRRVAANASDGTDHGTSGPVFVAGIPVKGGLYGDDPSLTDLARGDLKTTTDFRDVYAELLGTVLGTDPSSIVGKRRKPLGFLG